MGLQDRDWYHDEIRRRQGSGPAARSAVSWPPGRRRRLGYRRVVMLLLAFAVVVGVATDLRDQGIPLTWHGLKWWASLWLRP